MPLKLWSIDNPTYLKEVLPFFQTAVGLTNDELAKVTAAIGLSDSVRRVSHLTQFWYVLGVLDRAKESNRAYRYNLSKFGETVLNHLRFGSPLVIELLHWAMYSTWQRSPDAEKVWSWLYQEACNTMWEDSPKQVIPGKLLADISEKAASYFPDKAPIFDVYSIRAVTNWLSTLEPPFLVKKDESHKGSPWLSRRRESCSPELLFLAIQLQYHTKGLSYGTPLLMDESLIEAACKAGMLACEQFWPMTELCSLTFPSLVRKETMYGTSLMITEAAPFTPPEPRSLVASSNEGDE